MGGDGPNIEVLIVVAVAANGVIGRDGAMPWRLSTDLRRFKAVTMGKPVIMGRRTYQSIGKALPGRTNIVITRDAAFHPPDAMPAGSIDAALEIGRRQAAADGSDAVCILGGGQIYRQTLPLADRIHITYVDSEPDGDTRFPDIDAADWRIEHEERIPAGEKDSAATRYVVYRRQ